MSREAAYPVSSLAKVTTFVLSLIGLGLSTYLTITHFDAQLLACSSTGTIDCALVTTSAQSYFLGIPVAFLGLGNYLVLTAINSPWGWNAPQKWVHQLRFALVVVSMLFVLWLIYAELVLINHICLYCTAVHVVTFLLLLVLSRVTPVQLGWVESASTEE